MTFLRRFRRPILAGLVLCLLAPGGRAEEAAIAFAAAEAKGAKVVNGFKGTPADGVLATFPLTLPAYTAGCLFTDYATFPWPGADNRALPWVFGAELAELYRRPFPRPPQRQNLFTVFALADGAYLALVPLTGPKTMGWLETLPDGRLVARIGTLGTDPIECDAPVIAWARSADVYRACNDAWLAAVAAAPVKGRVQMRAAKTYPEPFRYLGWCSWEHYKKDIDARLLGQAVDQIEASGTPIRWLLVDDGHQTVAGGRLASLAPDAQKFPQGWAPLLARRRPDKIRWMGLWHAFNGIFGPFDGKRGQLALENQFGPLDAHLQAYTFRDGTFKLPRPDAAAASAWFDALIGGTAAHGFDFVKIDAQTRDLIFYRGERNAVETNGRKLQALGAAVERHGLPLINCMAANSPCLFNTRASAVTRCSPDYVAGDLARGRTHLHQSFHASLVLGQTVWPDHDMFHSSDSAAGGPMALSKALSGAPIYLSDDPKDFRSEFIRPLCYDDGELLRPLAPAVPLPDSIFADPVAGAATYRVVAPLAHGCAAVALFHLTEEKTPSTQRARVTAGDYPPASAMLQPYPGSWSAPAGGLVAWEWHRGRGARLDRPLELTLEGLSSQLVLLCPIVHGWAVVGRADKFLSPAAVTALAPSADRLELTLAESGPLVVWSAHGEPRADGVAFTDAGNGFWRADLPRGQRDRRLVLRR